MESNPTATPSAAQEQGVKIRCQDCKTEQVIYTKGMPHAEAKDFAGLMDGSSPFYVYPPPVTRKGDPVGGFLGNPGIGQCKLCGGHFVCTLFGFEEPAMTGSGEQTTRGHAIVKAARAAYEANRAYCAALGDHSQVAWEDAPDWQRASYLKGVEGVLAGNGPEQSHASWLEEKRATGWSYGPIKDVEQKLHPCFVPYAELPSHQKAKDQIFVAIVRAVLVAHGLIESPPAKTFAAGEDGKPAKCPPSVDA